MHSRLTRGAGAAIALTLGAAGLVGCSSNDEGTSSDSITLHTSWLEGESRTAKLHEIIDAFTAETGISVTWLQNGDELNQVYETAVLAGDEADVVLTNLTDKQLEWAKSGAVVPVNDLVSEWGLDGQIPADAITDWTDDEGNLRAFPYVGFSWPMWYNTDLLAEAGVDAVPSTSDELVAAAQALRAAGIAPLTIGGSDWSGQKLLLLVIESMMSDEDAETVLSDGGYCTTPSAMAGVELFVELRDAGVFVDGVEGLTADLSTAAYLDQQAAIAFMGSWSFLDTSDELAAATELGGLPLQDGSPFAKPVAFRGSTGGGWWISPNGEKKLDTVKQLIDYVYSSDAIGTLIDQTGVITVTAVDPEVAAGAGNELMAAAVSTVPDTVDFPLMPDTYVPGPVAEPMYRATSVAFTPGNDAAAVCKALDDAYASAS